MNYEETIKYIHSLPRFSAAAATCGAATSESGADLAAKNKTAEKDGKFIFKTARADIEKSEADAADRDCGEIKSGKADGADRLSGIRKIMQLLGDPHKNVRFIHVAGTNGKGSTCAMLSFILEAAGYKTGLFISPYIHVFNERIQINNKNISDEDLALTATEVRKKIDSAGLRCTQFEFNTAIAMVWFSKQKCDLVVLEVGMGGEFDASNVIEKSEVSVICHIGLDHTEILGDTIEKIAAAKAGIIKKGCPVVLYKQEDAVFRIVKEVCDRSDSQLSISEPELLREIHEQGKCPENTSQDPEDLLPGNDEDVGGFNEHLKRPAQQRVPDNSKRYKLRRLYHPIFKDLELSLMGNYQLENAAVVLKTVEILRAGGIAIGDEAVRVGLRSVRWPGRFEILNDDPLFIVDGAHNPQGIHAVLSGLKESYNDRSKIFIVGVLKDKDYIPMLCEIMNQAVCIILVTPNSERAADAKLLASQLEKIISKNKIIVCDSINEAIDRALSISNNMKDPMVISLGSLYTVAEVRKYFMI